MHGNSCLAPIVLNNFFFGGHTNRKRTHQNTRNEFRGMRYDKLLAVLFSGRKQILVLLCFYGNFNCNKQIFSMLLFSSNGMVLFVFNWHRFFFCPFFFFFSDSTSKKVANRCKERESRAHSVKERISVRKKRKKAHAHENAITFLYRARGPLSNTHQILCVCVCDIFSSSKIHVHVLSETSSLWSLDYVRFFRWKKKIISYVWLVCIV